MRLEGRKILVVGLHWGVASEQLFRVDVFRRTIRRANSLPLIQFYGPRASRRWKVDDPKPKQYTEVDETASLRTVDLNPRDLRLAPVKRGKRK